MPDGMEFSKPVNYEQMTSTLLSRQPVEVPGANRPDPVKGWQVTYNHLQTRMNSLRTWRYSWWTYWGQLAAYFSPKRWIYLAVANRTWRGSPINDQIIDSTGLQAVRTAAGGMWSGLTNPNAPWFKLGSALNWVKQDAAAKAWFEGTQERIYAVLAQSNFYDIMHQAFSDELIIGTAPIICYEDFEDVVRFYLPCAGEYYLGIGPRLTHDTFAREFTLTCLQIVEMFGLENCPSDVQKLWADEGGSVDQEFVVAHMIEPNYPLADRKSPGAKVQLVPSSFPYRELYWIKGNKGERPLSARGFMSFPVGVFLWSQVQNDAYGRSPCMDALGDNKQVQKETLRKAEFIEKGVRPPMGANVQMKNEPASIQPAHITYVTADQTGKGFWPLFEPNPAWLPALTTDIEQVNERIEKCLFVDVFMAISQMAGVQPRNELELTQRNLERLQSLGPVITSTEGTLAILLQRVLDIMVRRKMVDPLPPSLQGVPLKVSFISIMRMAQQASVAVAMKDVLATAGSLESAAQAAGLPSPIRVINLDAAMRQYADSQNFPIACLFTEDEVAANDKAHAQAQQAASAPNNLMAAVQAAHTLSQTPTGGGTALSAAVGAAGGTMPGS
jgi:hypothetical protein